ncbi:MAG TPA: succinate dehydrogenase, partial [Nitrospirota bacterium]
MALTDNLFWRRLHSFTGALPLGAYLVFHLYMNSYSVFGPDVYNGQVAPLRRLPYLLFIEIFFIFIPLAYHSLYGIYIWYTGRWNALQYGYARNWLFTLQRVTGLVTLVFVVFHVYDQRFRPEALFENVWGS